MQTSFAFVRLSAYIFAKKRWGRIVSEQRAKIRIFMEEPLSEGALVSPTAQQMHYLLRVMRLDQGSPVLLFDGKNGEWLGNVTAVKRNQCQVQVVRTIRAQMDGPDIWLAFAPIKKSPMDYLIEKATELGVARLLPVITRRTVVSRVNEERLRAIAIEAAEQCGRLSVPMIDPAVSLEKFLADWPDGRRLLVADETGGGQPLNQILDGANKPGDVFLIGPEGGFDARELDELKKQPFFTGVDLGPRILRAETAAVAALSCWQALAGDWTETPATI